MTLARRTLLKSMLAGGFAAAGGSLGWLQRAHAMSDLAGAGDYRALVIVFLFGGNDASNMLVPTGEDRYARYRGIRTGLSLARDSLLPLSGSDEGLHPSMPGLQSLHARGDLAVVRNVGSLITPVSRTALERGSVSLPAQLFSHSDQQDQTQRGTADLLDNHGWLGLAADALESYNPPSALSPNLSFAGTNILQTGRRMVPYVADTEEIRGLVVFEDGGPSWTLHDQLLGRTRANALAAEHLRRKRDANDVFLELSRAFANLSPMQTVFPASPLGAQLEAVTRYLAVRDQFGFRRQTFFVGVGDYDTHDNQLVQQALNLAQLDTALTAFDAALGELGLRDAVTTSTLSEFGRTLTINGDGTDHGWAGHNLVLGGAVRGGVYGAPTSFDLAGADDTGEGNIIPSISNDTHAATLLRWFGLSEGEVQQVLPNLRNFDGQDVGFMNV
ncbi:MAG: DUF1501 domain-containing protein [Pseudomonadota bacterium]